MSPVKAGRLNIVDINTTAVANDGLELNSVARIVTMTAVGAADWINKAFRLK